MAHTNLNGFNVEGNFPAFITADHKPYDKRDFVQALQDNKDAFHQLLLKHGALVFRGFPLADAADFANFVQNLGLGNFVNYIGGDSPRDKVEDKVYTSTEAPANLHIPLHQELSFIKNFPRHIYFFCETPPQVGGETIIGDARRVLRDVSPGVRQKFQARELTYISHYYHTSKVMELMNRIQRSHKSWTEVFEADNKQEVEKKCLENEFEWRWLKQDWLEVKQTRPAIQHHPLTGDNVWFNQAHLYDFNPKLLGWGRYVGAKLFYFRKHTRMHEISFGDKGRVPRRDLYHIMDVLQRNTVAFPWQAGDAMVLDNILTMHGRAPFTGKRRVLTAMTS